LGGLLFQVGGADPWTLSGGAGLLLLAALIASCMPAWRAVRTNPVEVLKSR
jgi:ABC-type lipoprotein release transport system permease subunit